MNWEAISAIGQLVGALAVVISLRATLDNFNRLRQQLTGDPDLAGLYYRGCDDLESLEGVDRSRFDWFMHQIFRNMEDVHHQHLQGHLEPHLWRGLEVTMRDLNTAPGVQAWWRSHSHYFGGDEFAKFINQQQQTATRHDD